MATPAEIFEDLQRSGWVVDLRSGADYAAEHLPGTVNIGAGPQLTATLGWLKPWDAPLTLLADSAATLRDAERQLARIGVPVARGSIWGDDLRGAAGRALRSYPVATFDDVQRRPLNDLVLDVRDAVEYSAGHLVGSVNVPTYELIAHMDQLPRRTIWVHCAAGYRSAVAASLIAATGRDVRYVADSFDSAVALGMTSLTTLPSEPLAAGSGGR